MNLAQVRKQAGLTQEDLAFKAGTERAHISRIETYGQSLTVDMAGRLAHCLGAGGDTLLRGHTVASVDVGIERLSSSAKGLVGSTTFSSALKALRALAADDEVPAEVVHLAAKIAGRLLYEGRREEVWEYEKYGRTNSEGR